MQQSSAAAAAFSTISPSAPLPGYRRLRIRPGPRLGLGPSPVGVRCRWRPVSLAHSSIFFPSGPCLHPAHPLPDRGATVVGAAAGGECKAGSEALADALLLAALFALWYIFNIYFNIYNKQKRKEEEEEEKKKGQRKRRLLLLDHLPSIAFLRLI